MRMGHELTIEQQQKLVMTPELKLALKILQLPTVELEELIQQELEINPILELVEEPKDERLKAEQGPKDNKLEKEIDWKEYMQFQGKSYCLEGYENNDEAEQNYENYVSNSHTLKDHLLFQLHLALLRHNLKDVGELIIESIDENGYLTISTEELMDVTRTDACTIEKVLNIIQTFDPAGVGARDLKECLLIQLSFKGLLNERTEKIVQRHLDDIACNRLNNISKSLGVSLEMAQQLSDMIKSLEPKPGRAFESSNSTKYIVPDVYIDKIDDEYIITINDHYNSSLRISQYYRNLLQQEEKTSQASQFISNKLSSAMWLIKSIEQRKTTLYNVIQAIVEYQREFFDKGVMYLRTMTLKNIADKVSVHESTVSRAINGKYVQTNRGVFEIKYFFTSGVDNQIGDGISSESIKRMLKNLIDKENHKHPISDQYIADSLTKEGLVISRRTVAKYRDELGIPSSSKRKRY
ncbi:MAG: RNA polymerase sigma-54 factor [Clostridiales bacterium GWB2_37_7]|nr:MAG: RNA polymerase sigma-54 factor [Clostridiales bacterium GWB2_37_7]